MVSRAVLTVLAFLVLIEQPAHAYVDPGSGGMLMQLLVAGFIGGLVVARSTWRRIRGLFERRPPEPR
jgi:hypothetical protein